MSFANYTEAALLNALFGKTSDLGTLSSAPTLYVALHTSDPGDDDSGAEATYTSYARVVTAAGDWNAAQDTGTAEVDNANAITFPAATGGSETVTHFGLYDAASAGNLIASGALTASLAVSNGVEPEFAANALTVSLD